MQKDTVRFSGSAPMRHSLFVNGQRVASSSNQTLRMTNPATQADLGSFPEANAADVDLAVKAAQVAFKTWSKTSPSDRAKVLREIGQIIATHADELAALETENNGKPLEESKADVADSARHFEYFADQIEQMEKSGKLVDRRQSPADASTIAVTKVPVGVAGQIIPWNYPLMMAAWKLAPALAAGCTSVIKPAEQTPLSLLKLAEYLEQSKTIPKGIINIVTGGAPTGKALLEHPGISIYSFTGSTEVGRIVQTAAAAHPAGPRPVILELGGKSPNIVFDDANIDNAVKGALFGIMVNQGEVCSAGSRILVQRSVYNEFVQKMADMAKNIKLGPGTDPTVKMGPLVSKEHTERVLGYIEDAKKSGARLVTGGGRPTDPALANGNYVLPTIFADVDPNSKLAQEEVFGPVAAIIPFDTEEEAIQIANNTAFGLAAAVWTKDAAKADRVADAVDAGIIWQNASQPAMAEIPWGGVKASGFGKDKLESYMTEKTIYKHFDADNFIDWYPPQKP